MWSSSKQSWRITPVQGNSLRMWIVRPQLECLSQFSFGEGVGPERLHFNLISGETECFAFRCSSAYCKVLSLQALGSNFPLQKIDDRFGWPFC